MEDSKQTVFFNFDQKHLPRSKRIWDLGIFIQRTHVSMERKENDLEQLDLFTQALEIHPPTSRLPTSIASRQRPQEEPIFVGESLRLQSRKNNYQPNWKPKTSWNLAKVRRACACDCHRTWGVFTMTRSSHNSSCKINNCMDSSSRLARFNFTGSVHDPICPLVDSSRQTVWIITMVPCPFFPSCTPTKSESILEIADLVDLVLRWCPCFKL